jgi:hypothetical protein
MPIVVSCSHCGSLIDEVCYSVTALGADDLRPITGRHGILLHWHCLPGWATVSNTSTQTQSPMYYPAEECR